MEKTTEEAEKRVPGMPTEAELEAQLREIRALAPEIQTLADVLKLDTAEAFRSYVRRGLDLKDAFLLANRERLLAAADERASVRQKAAGKAHLQATASRGEGAVSVPAAELRLYRELLPGLSESEIRRHYNEDRKQMRG